MTIEVPIKALLVSGLMALLCLYLGFYTGTYLFHITDALVISALILLLSFSIPLLFRQRLIALISLIMCSVLVFVNLSDLLHYRTDHIGDTPVTLPDDQKLLAYLYYAKNASVPFQTYVFKEMTEQQIAEYFRSRISGYVANQSKRDEIQRMDIEVINNLTRYDHGNLTFACDGKCFLILTDLEEDVEPDPALIFPSVAASKEDLSILRESIRMLNSVEVPDQPEFDLSDYSLAINYAVYNLKTRGYYDYFESTVRSLTSNVGSGSCRKILPPAQIFLPNRIYMLHTVYSRRAIMDCLFE